MELAIHWEARKSPTISFLSLTFKVNNRASIDGPFFRRPAWRAPESFFNSRWALVDPLVPSSGRSFSPRTTLTRRTSRASARCRARTRPHQLLPPMCVVNNDDLTGQIHPTDVEGGQILQSQTNVTRWGARGDTKLRTELFAKDDADSTLESSTSQV